MDENVECDNGACPAEQEENSVSLYSGLYAYDLDSDTYSIEALEDDPLVPPSDPDDGSGGETFTDMQYEPIEKPAKCSRKSNLSLCASFFKRRFVGETSGSLVTSKILSGDSIDEILQEMWAVVKSIVHKEVIFVDDNGNQLPTWNDNEPLFDDMGKFVYLQNQENRRRINIDQISSKQLISWRGKDIRVHVHIYSTSVSCKQLWELVDKHLVKFQQTDRAGAPNNQCLSQLADELRQLHGMHFSGQASSWKLWANYIHTVPAHEREKKKTELPPQSIIKFFRSVPISEAVQLECTRNGLSVARTINDSFSSELAALEEEADQLISLGQRVKHRISALRARSSINSSLVSAMQEFAQPEDSEISRSLADKVSDMFDIDHM